MNRKNHDVEKQRNWQRTIGDAARGGMSIREFCRQRRLKESQFYWWQRKLKASRQERDKPGVQRRAASFALVSEDGADPAMPGVIPSTGPLSAPAGSHPPHQPSRPGRAPWCHLSGVKRETLLSVTIRLLGLLPGGLALRLLVFFHCFLLLLGCLPIRLLLFLGRQHRLARIFCDTRALRFGRYRPCNTQGNK